MDFSVVGLPGAPSVGEGKREQFLGILGTPERALKGGELPFRRLFPPAFAFRLELHFSRVDFGVVLDLAQLLIVFLVGHVQDDHFLVPSVEGQWDVADEFGFYWFRVFQTLLLVHLYLQIIINHFNYTNSNQVTIICFIIE